MKWRVSYYSLTGLVPRLPELKPIHARVECLTAKGWDIAGYLRFDLAAWKEFQALLGPGTEIINELSSDRPEAAAL